LPESPTLQGKQAMLLTMYAAFRTLYRTPVSRSCFAYTLCIHASVARFFFVQHTKTGKNVPNELKIYQMAVNRTQRSLNIPLQDPPKFTQIGIFGFKTSHLATLTGAKNSSSSLSPETLLRNLFLSDFSAQNNGWFDLRNKRLE
jgi:hypothetical protein